jgi:hypothetical protein
MSEMQFSKSLTAPIQSLTRLQALEQDRLGEYNAARQWALANGRTDWGHTGKTRGVHTHDLFCEMPTDVECRLAGVQPPFYGWRSR